MKISVILPIYNENINEINDSISSVLKQTYSNLELIVDDNPLSKRIRTYLLNIQNKND